MSQSGTVEYVVTIAWRGLTAGDSATRSEMERSGGSPIKAYGLITELSSPVWIW